MTAYTANYDKKLGRYVSLWCKQHKRQMGGDPHQPHPGTHVARCGCSLPGLTGFTS